MGRWVTINGHHVYIGTKDEFLEQHRTNKNIPDSIKPTVSKARNWIRETFGDIGLTQQIKIDEKRAVGDRMAYWRTDNSIHIAKTELPKFNSDDADYYDDAHIVHEYVHGLAEKYIYKGSIYAKEQSAYMKDFVKKVSERSGVKLTQAKIKDLFGNYAIKDSNTEFPTMAIQKYYEFYNKLGHKVPDPEKYPYRYARHMEKEAVQKAVIAELQYRIKGGK